MIIFRNLNLRRTLSILLLFTALFSQIQLLYACDSMEDKPKHVCCCGEHSAAVCPMADKCAMHEQIAETACCEVSYDTLINAGMMNSTTTMDYLSLLPDDPPPFPVIDVAQFLLAPLPVLSMLSPPDSDETLTLGRDKPTYLLTRRLRL